MSTLQGRRTAVADELLRHLKLTGLAPKVHHRLAPDNLLQESSSVCWQKIGAADLTVPGAIPAGDFAARMRVAGHVLQTLAEESGSELSVDGAGLLTQRSRMTSGHFSPSFGRTLRGHGILLQASDGWVALNLPRSEDLDMLPALSKGLVEAGDITGLEAWVPTVPSAQVLETASLLSLPAAHLPRPSIKDFSSQAPTPVPWIERDLGHLRTHRIQELRVVDLTGLWAGPLCTSLLASAGARVVRLQGIGRPLNSSPYDCEFTQMLQDRVEVLRLDLRGSEAKKLLATADIIVTSSRPDALRRLGIRPKNRTTWVRITAHGSQSEDASRVGFGDDVAVAAGAVAYTSEGPTFAADALCDPATGLLAAVATLGSVRRGRAALLDLSLARSARWARGPLLGVDNKPNDELRVLVERLP